MTCPAKHTVPQIPEEDWCCPKCGKPAIDKKTQTNGWVIDEPDPEALDDCNALHDKDMLFCYACDYGMSGKSYAKHYAKKKSLVTCPHCKGTGVVKGSTK
jgi:ssDNA-binding Zn-finger/Zn-ribbon topoisomerase 1